MGSYILNTTIITKALYICVFVWYQWLLAHSSEVFLDCAVCRSEHSEACRLLHFVCQVVFLDKCKTSTIQKHNSLQAKPYTEEAGLQDWALTKRELRKRERSDLWLKTSSKPLLIFRSGIKTWREQQWHISSICAYVLVLHLCMHILTKSLLSLHFILNLG